MQVMPQHSLSRLGAARLEHPEVELVKASLREAPLRWRDRGAREGNAWEADG